MRSVDLHSREQLECTWGVHDIIVRWGDPSSIPHPTIRHHNKPTTGRPSSLILDSEHVWRGQKNPPKKETPSHTQPASSVLPHKIINQTNTISSDPYHKTRLLHGNTQSIKSPCSKIPRLPLPSPRYPSYHIYWASQL